MKAAYPKLLPCDRVVADAAGNGCGASCDIAREPVQAPCPEVSRPGSPAVADPRPQWQVVEDGSADGGRALAQLTADASLYRISRRHLQSVSVAGCRSHHAVQAGCGKNRPGRRGHHCASSMRSSITSRGPMPWKTTFVSIGWPRHTATARDRGRRQSRIGRMAYADAAGTGRPVPPSSSTANRCTRPPTLQIFRDRVRAGSGRTKADSVTRFDRLKLNYCHDERASNG